MRMVRSLKSHLLTTLRMTYRSLVPKTDPDLATCPLGPTKPHKTEKKFNSKGKKKCKPNGLIPFTRAVCRAEKPLKPTPFPELTLGTS